MAKRYRISLEGIVQGVGFRPFVKKLADRLGLPGIAFNTAGGLVVEIDAAGSDEARRFVDAIEAEAPRASRIERCLCEEVPASAAFDGFQIAVSTARDASFTLISPDLAICEDCLTEIQNINERRYRYPFTNCTNCGPRYTITITTPYDRANTTMARFPLCAACAAEYANPADRRFHAEPVACPVCGPRLTLDIAEAAVALAAGQILAIKGLGGYQLACDAFRAQSVETLRVRKRRSRKPFAVMMRDVAAVERYCALDPQERAALESAAAPIVLLAMRQRGSFPEAVAPGLGYLGVMLPYTPMHHLLFSEAIECLVMTSGNISEEPIVIRNDEALAKLSPLADLVVTHDRDIFMRVDDSVVRVFEETPRVLRRARGYAPGAIPLGREVGEVLAVGPELKNTFCLTKGRYAVMSQHIGDMENLETLEFFEETLGNLQSVYQVTPQVIAHDLHPDYLTTRWAMARPEPKIAVQHHHAHVASCMAENAVNDPVIGVAFDGTGYGADGQVWGGEFLVCDYSGFERWAHLEYVALPGGDRAAKQGWRMAAAFLGPDYRSFDLPCWSAAPESTWKVIDQLIARPGIQTSSCGRLFDAVSAICGISAESNYEGESAMLLEAAADLQSESPYAMKLNTASLPWTILPWTIETRPMARQIAAEIAAGERPGAVARRFHDSIAQMIAAVCGEMRNRCGLNRVCLSGGTFQNLTLLSASLALLRAGGFEVFTHSRVPPNDGGISLGQAAIAAVLLAGSAFAQSNVEGVAVDSVTRQPIAGVHVTLRQQFPRDPDENAYGAISRQDGRFSITGLKPAVYGLNADRTGYAYVTPKAAKGVARGVIELKGGATEVTVEMVRKGGISGHVLDQYGDPMQHVQVLATPVAAPAIPDEPPEGREFRTDERGWFRLRVAPGKYYVTAVLENVPPISVPEIRNDGRGTVLEGTTYYPGTSVKEQAAAIEVVSGEDVNGIDIRLAGQRAFSISGVVSGLPQPGTVWILREPGHPVVAQAGPDGRFSAQGLPPGTYRLIVSGGAEDQPLQSLPVEVKLENADAVGVELRMVPAETLSGTVELERGKLPGGIRVRLSDDSETGGRKQADVGRDGEFRIPQVFPGRYRVSLLQLPENAYLKSPEGVLDLSGGVGNAKLRITIGLNGGRVEGRVLNAEGEPLKNDFAMVVLAMKDEAIDDTNTKHVEGDAKFSFAGLRPGKYRLIAAHPGEDYQALLAQAPEFEVREGDRIAKDVKVSDAR